MPTVEKTSGGSVYIRPLERDFEVGDRAGVDESMATYLCEERGDFERLDAVTDAEFTEVEDTDLSEHTGGLEDLTKDELYEIASEEDIEGRSEMTKDELIAALEED